MATGLLILVGAAVSVAVWKLLVQEARSALRAEDLTAIREKE